MLDFDLSTNLSKRMASFLFFLSCFDSLVYCEYFYPCKFYKNMHNEMFDMFCYNGMNESFAGVHCATQAEIDQHLALGMNLLARGSYSDALSHFHAAVDADPNNYMSYYKRATVYMALSRPRPALADLDKIMQIKPDFLKARQQRGGLLLKMGRLNEVNIYQITDLTLDFSSGPHRPGECCTKRARKRGSNGAVQHDQCAEGAGGGGA